MATYTEVPVIDAASQQLSTSLGEHRIDLSLISTRSPAAGRLASRLTEPC